MERLELIERLTEAADERLELIERLAQEAEERAAARTARREIRSTGTRPSAEPPPLDPVDDVEQERGGSSPV